MEHRRNEVHKKIVERPEGRIEIHSRDPRRHQENGHSGATGRDPLRNQGTVSSWVGWQAALYAFVLGAVSLFLVPLTSHWWIVPVLGGVVPLALVALERLDLKSRRPADKKDKEGELLGALAEQREITPTAAAMRTSLTVEEASRMLDELAGKGHLKLRADEGTYALRERDRPPASRNLSVLPEQAPQDGAHLDDPMSERELEVLTLLASGRTNAEIARDLFVAVGTVKSHTGNIYRKLGARNRAEALSRAREMNLLR